MEAHKCVLFLIFITQAFGGDFDPVLAVAQAIDQMLKIHFAQKTPKVDLVYFGSVDESQHIIEFLMQHNQDQISFQVIDGNRFGSKQFWPNSSSIMLFESLKNFTQYFESIKWQDDYNNEQKNHIVYFPKGLRTDLDSVATYYSVIENNTIPLSFNEIRAMKKKVTNGLGF